MIESYVDIFTNCGVVGDLVVQNRAVVVHAKAVELPLFNESLDQREQRLEEHVRGKTKWRLTLRSPSTHVVRAISVSSVSMCFSCKHIQRMKPPF